MIKQILTAAIAILGLSFGTTSVHAVEAKVDCVADPANEACIVTTSDDYGVTPISETPTSYNTSSTESEESTKPVAEPTDQDDKSTSDNAPEEVIVEEDEVEVEEEPAMWPVYLSLGALGLAVLVFIILNLFGGKRK